MSTTGKKIIAVIVVVAIAAAIYALLFLSNGGVAKAGGATFRQKWRVVEIRRQQLAPVYTTTRGGGWCRAETVGADGLNMLGGKVMTVWSRTNWCSNGSRYTDYQRDHWIEFHGGAWNPWAVKEKFDPVTTNGCCVGAPGYEWRRVRYEYTLDAMCVFSWCLRRTLGTNQWTAYQTRAYYRESVFG